VAETTVPLLDASGQWTHRDRHRHHEFAIDVPERTVELRARLSWDPLDMGSEHEANSLALTLWGPDGFRGGAVRRGDANDLVIGESAAKPGGLPGPIQAGRWVLNIDTGLILPDGAEAGYLSWRLEASAVVGDRTAVVEATSTSAARRPEPGGPRWYRGDLHSHTTHSDGEISVEDRVRGAVMRGLDFLAITDHNTISHHAELDGWPDGISPIRASEITTFHGHMNVFGLATAIDWRGDRRGSGPAAIVEQAHRQHALVSINHPSAFGDPWCVGCHWDFARADYATIDAMEVWNGRWAIPETDNQGGLALWTDLLDAGFRLTAVSGTDSHSAEEDAYVALPMTYVHAADRSEASILDGIRLGHVFVSSGPLLSFRARGSDGREVSLPGDSMGAGGRVDLVVDVERLEEPATIWFVTPGSTVPLGAGDGGQIHVTSDGLNANGWWRLEVRAGSAANGDMLALANPVYASAG